MSMNDNEMFAQFWWAVAIVAVMGFLVIGGVSCHQASQEGLIKCIEATQKPLECKARISQ